MKDVVSIFIEVLTDYLKGNYLKKKSVSSGWCVADTRYFAKGIVRLNEIFTFERSERRRNYFDDPVLRSGYLAYFLPINAIKTSTLCGQHDLCHEVPQKLVVSDLGAGPLTMSLGFLFSLIEKMSVRHQPVHVTVHAFEQNKKILADGVSLLRAFLEAVSAKSMGLTVEVVPYAIDLARGRLPRVLSDVILVGNLLNELGRRDAQQLVLARMLDSLCQKKFLLLMLEPAHKKISRDLQSLRDYLIQRFSLNVVGPCLHSLACPLNQVNKRDWCHQRLIWDVPELIRDFDRLTKLKKVYLQYSYLLLRPDRVAGERSADTFLAITDVMLVGRQKELVACSRGGLYRFVLPAATSQPRFSQLRRGDTFSPMPHVIMHKVV